MTPLSDNQTGYAVLVDTLFNNRLIALTRCTLWLCCRRQARACIEQAEQQGLQNILLKSVPFGSLPEDCLDCDGPGNNPVLVMAFLGEDAASAAPTLAGTRLDARPVRQNWLTICSRASNTEFVRSKLAEAGTVASK